MSVTATAVALLATATLSFEILLVRVFAVEHFHHVAYMAIGVAMLGIGASGAAAAALGGVRSSAAQRWFPAVALCTALSLIATPVIVHRIPLDLTELAWNADQWLRLGAVYLLLALPFALGALATLLAITVESARTGWIYGANFLGSGVGALVAVGLLWIAHPSRALAVPALVAALGAAVAASWSGTRSVRQLGGAVLMLTLLVVLRPPWRVSVSPYKGLPQVEAYPDARRVAERTSPLGWVVAVRAPAFRHAPGLSLAYEGEFPPQTALFVDGEIADATTHWGASGTDSSAMEIVHWLPTAIPYALGSRTRVLVLGAGGGMEVWVAVAHGAGRIIAVELNSEITAMSAGLAPLPTRATTGAEIAWVSGDARTVVARTAERFDLITLAPGGGITGAAGGVHALNEDFLHTTDAYVQYLRRLTPDGVLVITRWATEPPRGSVRAILTAVEALRRVRSAAVGNGIVVARSWGTATVLVKPSGFSAADLGRLRAWAASRQVDLDWYPGAIAPEAQYNIPNEPTLVRAGRAAVAHPDSARRFADDYPFAVGPADDARPYPHRFLRAGSLRTFLRSGSASWLPFAEWGYIALLATLAQSALLAGLLILLPTALRARSGRAPTGSVLPLLAYFSAIGLGYMAAEIAVIQQLTLLLGHPVYAVAVVLAAILICSGVGSAWSDRLVPFRARRVGVALAGSLALLAAVLLDLVHVLQPAPMFGRGLAAAAVLVPIAVLMGTMFPLGIRGLAGSDGGHIAWAWGANGFASVVGAPLAALIAVEAGSRVLLFVAAIAYISATLFTRRWSVGTN
jgi:spermidine synthase